MFLDGHASVMGHDFSVDYGKDLDSRLYTR